ncbi:MAG: phosphoribosylformylglycinamidine synthase [Erysipelotrichales bacterium]|nr:phosphoribosylformylglycinamidine synthase [Erysipelotrichales bacterium]
MSKLLDVRYYVIKKAHFNTASKLLIQELNESLALKITNLDIYNVYDIFKLNPNITEQLKNQIISEPITDTVLSDLNLTGKDYLALEYLPGQFDQRALSAMECILLIDPLSEAVVTTGKIYLFTGLKQDELVKVKKYLLNPLESRVKDLNKLALDLDYSIKPYQEFPGFIKFNEKELNKVHEELNLAMLPADFAFIQKYFKEEGRDPNEAELKMLDTYWSDHCRHTTFETELTNIDFEDGFLKTEIENTLLDYIKTRKTLKRDEKPFTLMELATANARLERANGNLEDLEVSEENNACSIFVNCNFIDGSQERYLVMFKNETHNHPTEIEPFGGASTCLGGAIRDPLSGRTYVYQGMRITGAADVTEPISKTIAGKLPQRTITKRAAEGFASYGNQIGLTTTYVKEIYHPGYVAKRMEAGATVGAAKASHVVRITPEKGDRVIYVGGPTGRDGIGGATGSSKNQTEKSIVVSAAEVQKGNAPEERKLQRLMRNPNVTKLIKKANDFGAGGVSVAVGELTPSILINLDKVPLKYPGMNPMEILLSESQERMAFVVAAKDVKAFIDLCNQENLVAVEIAEVTDNGRMTAIKDGKKIVDIKRSFLETNGIRQKAVAKIGMPKTDESPFALTPAGKNLSEKLLNNLTDLNHASSRGLKEMFDSTIGSGTVFMPYGGKYQLTEHPLSIQLIPSLDKTATTATLLAHGYNPLISSYSPYLGGIYAVIEACAKIVAAGGELSKIRLSFQEFFERVGSDDLKWGKPLQALLGAYKVMKNFKLAAIGGKDSMSGTFKDIHVPPALIAFALCTEEANKLISNELKKTGNNLYLLKPKTDEFGLPDLASCLKNFSYLTALIKDNKVLAAESMAMGGLSKTLFNMAIGNKIGFNIKLDEILLFQEMPGAFIIETTESLKDDALILLGKTSNGNILINENSFNFEEIQKASESRLEPVFPNYTNNVYPKVEEITYPDKKISNLNSKKAVKVLLPIFPGTNCDYDTISAFSKHGATIEPLVFNNMSAKDITEAIKLLAQKITETDILVFSGGFSGGDEPDGSGKFIANVINQPAVKKAIDSLLSRKGLILGICNGFQALIKSGLLASGNLTLFHNDINRHVSKLVKVRYTGAKSPWFNNFKANDIQTVAISHGEGKFWADDNTLNSLVENGQVAYQYVDFDGKPSMDINFNPNGSLAAVEALISPCGLILGKMAHSERANPNIFRNIPNQVSQDIFLNAINYFREKQ